MFDARSMERSLGSEGSPGTSTLAEGGEDLVGVPQASVEKHQQLFVRYSGLSEGGALFCSRYRMSFKPFNILLESASSVRCVSVTQNQSHVGMTMSSKAALLWLSTLSPPGLLLQAKYLLWPAQSSTES